MEDYKMELVAIITDFNNRTTAIERKISLEPANLIDHINCLGRTVCEKIKDDILEQIAVKGTTPKGISVRVFCNDLILDFHKDLLLKVRCGLIGDIEQALFEFSLDMRKELCFRIVCTTKFRNQIRTSASERGWGVTDEYQSRDERGSLNKELHKNGIDATPSAFAQQRNKISSQLFRAIMQDFNSQSTDTATFNGYRILAVDGTCINMPRNLQSESFVSYEGNTKGYNQMHLNPLYDILNKTISTV